MTSPFQLAVNEIEGRSHLPQILDNPVPLEELPTPALLLDERLLDANIATMAAYLGRRNKGFRPHAKTHKCPLIAQRQLAAGAVGVCAAKVSEAVALANGGVTDILITSPITSRQKVAVVAGLAARVNLAIVVDQLSTVQLLASEIPEGATLDVLIDVDVEMGRTGTRSDDELRQLAAAIGAADRLHFAGIQHYAGHVMHIEGFAARRERSLRLWEAVAEKHEMLNADGFPCQIVTGCGTGTYNIDSEVPFITDLQVGSYIFMDQEYRLIGSRESDLFEDFSVSLTLLATAISQPMSRAVTVDGGYKAFASDSVNPEPLDLAGSKFRFAGDEHGVLILPEGYQEPVLGSVQRFITPHCDPTVNLHDAYWVHRDGLVVERWPITARGCSW